MIWPGVRAPKISNGGAVQINILPLALDENAVRRKFHQLAVIFLALPQSHLGLFASVMSREMEEAPMILPERSLMGEVVTETSISEPSLRRRVVSKLSTRSPRLMRSRICENSSSRSGGMMMESERPLASLAVIAIDPLGGRVPTEDDAVKGLADDGVVGKFDDGGVLQMRFLGPLPFGDVLDHRQRKLRLAGGVAHHGDRQPPPDDPPILAHKALFHLVIIRLAGEQLVE